MGSSRTPARMPRGVKTARTSPRRNRLGRPGLGRTEIIEDKALRRLCPHQGPRPLTGYVTQRLKGENTRVEGALVQISDRVTLENGELKPSPLRSKSALTDAEGVFRFTDLPWNTDLYLVAAKGEFWTKRADLVIARLSPKKNAEPFHLRLPEACEVLGRVVDSEGRPVPEAKVFLHESHIIGRDRIYPPDPSENRSIPEKSALSDAYGRFKIHPRRADARHTLVAQAKGFSQGRVADIRPLDLRGEIEIVLKHGGEVTGQADFAEAVLARCRAPPRTR